MTFPATHLAVTNAGLLPVREVDGRWVDCKDRPCVSDQLVPCLRKHNAWCLDARNVKLGSPLMQQMLDVYEKFPIGIYYGF